MPEKKLYEYAVIRLVPKVEREEFINIGIILFSKKANFIKVLVDIDEERLKLFSGEIDCNQLRENLDAFERISRGEHNAGPIAKEDLPSRFRWLTAIRSSMIQTSRPHPGKADDLEVAAVQLLKEYVG
ncbi:MAG: hypothetical protein A3D31_05015 [Candidatus Fluviicola riflensis]|nr:MAG: hypothetical protein CHH17_10005 [Candidatus Fluviicola riflensis]OGS79335.1 MAG: hypothetical protein A3D31_05015 [Candidatus Fluviicola riflensis]OGS86767.1 MAG: hypothetical protein A2724_04475 [Fluviicola sp. RIFCSPHIGHO2_01_FULL_43_53]OGS88760.1 MAG: hypothetical protein A3E30_00185 [Fluviicola sp. RIFCSPHIGHO2_12_FULL_43_24]